MENQNQSKNMTEFGLKTLLAFYNRENKLALSVKKALVDLWQLAFSYQVNPLAAVQPVPTATRGSR